MPQNVGSQALSPRGFSCKGQAMLGFDRAGKWFGLRRYLYPGAALFTRNLTAYACGRSGRRHAFRFKINTRSPLIEVKAERTRKGKFWHSAKAEFEGVKKAAVNYAFIIFETGRTSLAEGITKDMQHLYANAWRTTGENWKNISLHKQELGILYMY